MAWHFCTDKNTNKIEKVQERALCFVYNDYSSTYLELVDKAKVPTLQVRRIRTMALETFKIINNLSPTCLNSLVRIKTSKYSFGYSNILDLPRVRTSSTYGKKSFKFAAASLWNSLPDHFRRETASPSSKVWFNPEMARNVTVPHAFSFLLYMIFALFHFDLF